MHAVFKHSALSGKHECWVRHGVLPQAPFSAAQAPIAVLNDMVLGLSGQGACRHSSAR